MKYLLNYLLAAVFVVALAGAMAGFVLVLAWLMDLATWWGAPVAMILGAWVTLMVVDAAP